ncbi:MAG: MoxR family ATPase [Acidimicrobiia bacterium]|nr:MoxR family ATPase [Acidimicrobiia bacterium]
MSNTVAERARLVIDEVEKAVLGKRLALEMVLMAMLSDGHVLIEDYPGLAKTLMARSFAVVTGLEFARLQFTPDLMPMDITGSTVMDPQTASFEFRRGPVFSNLLLADEVNRAPAKTQAALLEAMQERQVTIDGVSHPIERPFLVIATQNPIEYEGTYPLPEAQLDRFIMRISVGYPTALDERAMLANRLERRVDEVDLDPVITPAELRTMQAAVEEVHVDPGILDYLVAVVAATREQHRVQVGSSPRGSLALLKLSRARAALGGRDFVTPDDVKSVAVSALAHRLILKPEMWVQDITDADIVRDCLEAVPVPPTVPGHS